MLSAFHFIFVWCAGSFVTVDALAASVPLLIAPKIFNAEVDTARRESVLRGDSSGVGQLESAAWLSALGGLEAEAGRPHAARAAWRRLNALCDEWRGLHYKQFQGSDGGRAAALCLQAAAEISAQDSFPIRWGLGKQIQGDWLAFQTADLEEAERLSLTGRIRTSLSPAYGQDFRAALVALRILERLAPATPATAYWIGKALERQGNTPMAEEAFAQALASTPPDPRAGARARRMALGDDDEPTYGWTPYLFTSPARGFGGGALLWDDRIADTRRAYRLDAFLSSRGNYFASAKIGDSATLAPLQLQLGGSFGYRKWDYFGAGMVAAPVQTFGVTAAHAELEIGSPAYYGWRLSGVGVLRHVDAAGTAPLSFEGSQGFGHVLEWDATDRRQSPRRGVRIGWRQEYLWTKASQLFFSRSLFEAEFHWPIALRHRLSLQAALGITSAFPALINGNFDPATLGAPGIREFRYQSAAMAASWIRYRFRLLNWLGAGLFGAAAAADTLVSNLPNQVKLGGGIDFDFVLARSPQFTPRWEMGVFNGEWIFQGGFRAGL